MHNPFARKQSNPSFRDELLEEFRTVYGKGFHWSDDLWLAYENLLSKHSQPDERAAIYDAWVELSEEFGKNTDRVPLGLSDWDEVTFDHKQGDWFGVKDDEFQRLPDWTKSYPTIEWDEDMGDWVGVRAEEARANPLPPWMVRDSGSGKTINLVSGEVME